MIINYEKDTAHLSNGGSLPSLSWLRVIRSPGNRLVTWGHLIGHLRGHFSGHVLGEVLVAMFRGSSGGLVWS